MPKGVGENTVYLVEGELFSELPGFIGVQVDGKRNGELFGQIKTIKNSQVCYIDVFETHPPKKGIGTLLMKAFVAELKARSINQLWSGYASPDAIHLRLKLFGENLLRFYDDFEDSPTFLPMTADQYIATHRRLEEYEDRDDDMYALPGVYVDLSQVDAVGWQRPTKLFKEDTNSDQAA